MNNPYHPFRFSRTGLRGLKASPMLTINEQVQEMRAAGQEVYHLGFGESRFPVHPRIAQALRDNAQQRSYLPALGIPALRQTVADYYQRRFGLPATAEQVIVGVGSKSLLYALMLALDGELILPTPAWGSYASQARLAGRPVMQVPLAAEAGYQVDVGRMGEVLDTAVATWCHPDLLILTNPHNPTGTTLSAGNVQAIAHFAHERGLMVLSDEIYAQVVHQPHAHTPLARHYPEGTITLGGLSKGISLGGWRLGLAILPAGPAGQALAHAIQAIAGCVWSCATAPVQYAALVAYSGDPEIEAYIDACTQMHAIRTRTLYDALTEFGATCPEPTGAFYVYPSFARWREPLAARGIHTCQELSFYLLERYEIATLPGAAFGGDPQELALRMSSSYLDAETDEQAEQLVAAFEQNRDPDDFIQNHHPRLRTVIARLAEFATELEADL